MVFITVTGFYKGIPLFSEQGWGGNANSSSESVTRLEDCTGWVMEAMPVTEAGSGPKQKTTESNQKILNGEHDQQRIIKAVKSQQKVQRDLLY